MTKCIFTFFLILDNEDQCAQLVCEAQSGNQGVGVALCRDLIGEKEIIVCNGVLKHKIL